MNKWLLLAALALCAAPAHAAEDRFATMDTDTNGQVDWNEFQKAIPNMKQPAFDMIDADKSGGISRPEWDKFRSGHGANGMPGGGMGSGMGMPPAGMGSGMGMPPAGMTAPEKGGMPAIQPPASPAKPGIVPPKN